MKQKWEPKAVRVTPRVISQEKYKARIAEVTEILYDLLCQLERSDRLPEPIEAGISPSNVTLHEERTGTHG